MHFDTSLQFANPGFLVLVALVPICGLFWTFLRARREKALTRIVAPALRSRLMPKGANLWGLQSALVLLGLFLVLFSASRPQWGRVVEKSIQRSRNVVIAIDVSRSMLAEDVRPNRLERTKADVADLIDSLGGDRCALVAFRRLGVQICPLTTDRGFLRSALEQLSPDSAPRGETDLGAAIRASLDALNPAADDHNAIIMISDGGDLRGEALANAELAQKRGVPIFTVGIGDPRTGAEIPADDGRGVQKFKGKPVLVKLEEDALKAIASASKGRYVPLATAGTAETTLGAIYRRFLRQVAAKEQNEESERRADQYQLFLVPGLILLIAGAALSKGRLQKLVVAMVVAFPLVSTAMMYEPRFDENLTVFLSDPHIAAKGIETKWGPQPDYQNALFAQAIDEVLKLRPLPRRVICLGDVALWFGFRQDYTLARAYFDRLSAAGIEIYLTMGNHDHRAAARELFPEIAARSPVPERFAAKIDLGTADLFLLDTLQENPAGEGSDNAVGGELDKRQRDWFTNECLKATRPFLVAAHHDSSKLGVRAFLNGLPLYRGWINGHGHTWQSELQVRNWLSNDVVFSQTLPSTGWSCDIGYAILRTESDRAVLSLVQSDFFFPSPLPANAPRPPAWDHQIRYHQNRQRIFYY